MENEFPFVEDGLLVDGLALLESDEFDSGEFDNDEFDNDEFDNDEFDNDEEFELNCRLEGGLDVPGRDGGNALLEIFTSESSRESAFVVPFRGWLP